MGETAKDFAMSKREKGRKNWGSRGGGTGLVESVRAPEIAIDIAAK